MKRAYIIVASIVALTAGLAFSGFADIGKEFGEHHSMHAKQGDLGKDMNPGKHKGITQWLEHHEDMHSMTQ